MSTWLRTCLLLVTAAPTACLAWYAPHVSRQEPAHANLTPDASDGDCLECHRPLDDRGLPAKVVLAVEAPASQHRDNHQHYEDHQHHQNHERTTSEDMALDAPGGPWFPVWMMEEDQPCVGCHSVR